MNFLDILQCPKCLNALPHASECTCGFKASRDDGVLDLTENDKREHKEFLEVYERIRRAEGWGGDDLDLPFHPRRHRDIWAIRQRTFRRFRSLVLETWPESERRARMALDVGAGNCWLTRYLAEWGFTAAALDINASNMDGLKAGARHMSTGPAFERIEASMTRLPFVAGRISMVVANAAAHYAQDDAVLLRELARILTADGIIAIVDSPFYRDAEDGERVIAARVETFKTLYDVPERLTRRSRGYLTYRNFQETALSAGLTCAVHPVWPGFRRAYEALYGRVVRRRIAEFPVVVLRKAVTFTAIQTLGEGHRQNPAKTEPA